MPLGFFFLRHGRSPFKARINIGFCQGLPVRAMLACFATAAHQARQNRGFPPSFRRFVLSWLSFPSAASAAEDPWAASYDAATGNRFIPAQLWTGSPWDGRREIDLPKADLTFGNRGEKRLRGPVVWTRPSTGETIQVYERLNKDKKQLFTISSDKTGMGRVFDSRYARDCIDEVKFPLGLWKQGEVRTYTVSCNGGAKLRPLVVTIQKIDFTYRGVAHSLQFHWLIDGGKGAARDVTYVYSPGKGLVLVEGEND